MSTVTPVAMQSSKPPIVPKNFSHNQPDTIRLYPLSNYVFTVKESQPEEDASVAERLKRLNNHYAEHGMRRTAEAVLLCHEHSHPHVLLLQIANSFFKMPGDYLKPEDDEITGFKKRLNERLAPDGAAAADDWDIGDCLAQWFRPNAETFAYPYVPPHVTRPKECKKIYMVKLPDKKVLSVPKNMKLLAVPCFELYDNPGRYGPQLAAIPHLLSRYRFEFVSDKGEAIASTPGGMPGPGSSIPQNPTPKIEPNEQTDEQANGDVKME
ncbi:MAG: hypothetical protein M1831_002440 [Alyxoria varia]|nr:MAG: hypothetical protein M1831_002440 [Alyxoria varia]